MKKLLLTTVFWSMGWLAVVAQPQNYHELMGQAKNYFGQKEYAKATECYERVIAELKGTDYETLIPTIKNGIAINHLYIGVAALKEEKDYPKAKTFLEKAIANAKPNSKTYYMVYSWMGQWYSLQAMDIQRNHGNMQQAVIFSLEAEKCFDLAQAPDKRLQEQLSRVSALRDLSKIGDAESLLRQIVAECENNPERDLIRGKALFALGSVELDADRYQTAIQYLEQGYELCNAVSAVEAKTYAYLSANKLSGLYSKQIPDAQKASLWKQRAEELESQMVK